MKSNLVKYFLLFLLCLAVSACKTTPSKKKTKAAKKYTVQKTVQPTRGFLIEGPANELAVINLFDQIIDLSEEEVVVVSDSKAPPYYNRLLKAVIGEKSTVSQVNQALKKAGVLISFSEEKIPQVTLLIPPPGGKENLKKYQAALEKTKVFSSVAVEVPEEPLEPITPATPAN